MLLSAFGFGAHYGEILRVLLQIIAKSIPNFLARALMFNIARRRARKHTFVNALFWRTFCEIL